MSFSSPSQQRSQWRLPSRWPTSVPTSDHKTHAHKPKKKKKEKEPDISHQPPAETHKSTFSHRSPSATSCNPISHRCQLHHRPWPPPLRTSSHRWCKPRDRQLPLCRRNLPRLALPQSSTTSTAVHRQADYVVSFSCYVFFSLECNLSSLLKSVVWSYFKVCSFLSPSQQCNFIILKKKKEKKKEEKK